jgi:3-isopropylmalate/(R)-2-methylmalate dehydratase large subunit
MSIDLLTLKVEKRRPQLRFYGRILYLVDDAELMRRQLNGEDITLEEARAKLRDQISTDEITPAYICYYFDETLREFPYLGLRSSGEFPVTRGAVKRGGFVCSVSGKRRGKGSSREQSPYAELMAGIRVVVAENIERIYNENCQNLGVLSTTDFSLIDRIRAGEEIPLSTFTEGVDPITKEIIEYGGLFEYNVARLQGKVRIPPITSQMNMGAGCNEDTRASSSKRGAGEPARTKRIYTAENAAGSWPPPRRRTTNRSHQRRSRARRSARHDDRGKGFCYTLGGRCAANRFGVPWVQPGDSGFVRTDYRFSHEYVSPMAAIFFEEKLG